MAETARYPFAPTGIKRISDLILSKTVSRSTDISGFNYDRAVENIKGPVVEIAGPTAQGYQIVGNKIPAIPFVTNASQGFDKLDALMDARHLPFRRGTIGMLLASCVTILPREELRSQFADMNLMLAKSEYAIYPEHPYPGSTFRFNQRIPIIEEASRVLEPNGLLVWRGGTEEDIRVAEYNGLSLVRVRSEDGVSATTGEDMTVYEAVFQNQSMSV